jgi:hypothetical protein
MLLHVLALQDDAVCIKEILPFYLGNWSVCELFFVFGSYMKKTG